MERHPVVDAPTLRRAFGQFATGVTVVTTIRGDDKPVGVTVNSFSSLSLEPPLLLWSLARNSGSCADFEAATHFAVHVLGRDQVALSQRFASRGFEKFEGITWDRGVAGVPLLEGCVARFVCEKREQWPGGDHTIFIGSPCDIAASGREPLVFHAGAYHTLQPASSARLDA